MRAFVRNVEWHSEIEYNRLSRGAVASYGLGRHTMTLEIEPETVNHEDMQMLRGFVHITAEPAAPAARRWAAEDALAKLRAADPSWVAAVLGEAPALPAVEVPALPCGIIDGILEDPDDEYHGDPRDAW